MTEDSITKAVSDIINIKWKLEVPKEEVDRLRLLLRRSVGYSWGNYMERVIYSYLAPTEKNACPMIILEGKL